MANITIDNRPLSEFGATLLAGSYASLLTPPQQKEWVSNDDPRKNGIEYIVPDVVKVKERNVELIFGIKGHNAVDFLQKYNSFISLIQGRIIKLHVPDLHRNYYLKYENCNSYDNFSLEACKVVVKFIEPDPTKTE